MFGETDGDLGHGWQDWNWIGLKRLRTSSGSCVSVDYSRIS